MHLLQFNNLWWFEKVQICLSIHNLVILPLLLLLLRPPLPRHQRGGGVAERLQQAVPHLPLLRGRHHRARHGPSRVRQTGGHLRRRRRGTGRRPCRARRARRHGLAQVGRGLPRRRPHATDPVPRGGAVALDVLFCVPIMQSFFSSNRQLLPITQNIFCPVLFFMSLVVFVSCQFIFQKEGSLLKLVQTI